jgi:large subunit ribosomal protein L25
MQGNRIRLEATPRTAFGKKNRALRRSGWVPANISGRGIPSTAIQLKTNEIKQLLAHTSRNTVLSVDVGTTEETVLIRDVTRRPTTDELYHVDFFRISLSEPVRASVPLGVAGESPAVKVYDAVVLNSLDSVEVESLPQDLPTQIEVSLEPLAEIDAALYVRDLRVPSGVTILTDADELVTKAHGPTLAVEEEEVAPAAEEEAAPAAVAEEAAESEAESEES